MTNKTPNFESANPFEVLGFTDKAQYSKLSESDIKKSYRKLISEYHPDKIEHLDIGVKEKEALLSRYIENSKNINSAKDLLMDSSKRGTLASKFSGVYSKTSNTTKNAKSHSTGHNGTNSRGRNWGNVDDDLASRFDDLFNDVFGDKAKRKTNSGTKKDWGSYWKKTDSDFDFDFNSWKRDHASDQAKRARAEIEGILAKAKQTKTAPDLSKLYLSDVDLSNLDLENAIFSSKENPSTFFNTNFTGSSLKGAKFDHASLYDVIIDGKNCEGASFTHARIRKPIWGCIIKGVNLSEANMSMENLNNLTFHKCNLSRLNFQFAKFDRVDFVNSNLTSTNFKYSRLNNIKYINSNLTDVDFRASKLNEVVFEDGTMKGTIFKKQDYNKEKIDISKANKEGIKSAESQFEKATDAKLNENGEIIGKWQQFIKEEKWIGKKGLAFSTATIALGAVIYGSWKLLEQQKEQEKPELSNLKLRL